MIDDNYFKVTGIYDKEAAVKSAVEDALKLFCSQDTEFERAITESGKTFKDCLKHVVSKCGNHISDFDLFSRAVDFYFAGAKIHFNMTIDLTGDAASDSADNNPTITVSSNKQGLKFSLDDLI